MTTVDFFVCEFMGVLIATIVFFKLDSIKDRLRRIERKLDKLDGDN